MQTFDALLRAWSDAGATRHTSALDDLLDAEFRGDGPGGLVLDKVGWLDRVRNGELAIQSIDWTAADVQVINGTAIASRTCLLQDRGGTVTCTIVGVRRDRGWAIVNLQIGQPRHRNLPGGRCSGAGSVRH